MENFIIYEGENDEVLITTPALEKECIQLWFTEGGRNIDEWHRATSREAVVEVTSRTYVS